MQGSSALIISQDQAAIAELRHHLNAEYDLQVEVVDNADDAQIGLTQRGAKMMLVDLRPEAVSDGFMQMLRQLRMEQFPDVAVIGITDRAYPLALADWADSVVADRISLPLEPKRFGRVWQRVAGGASHARRSLYCGTRTVRGTTLSFTTRSSELFPMLDDLELAARHDVTVLLIGETGTGKSYMAQLIHQLSPRARHRFLPVACGTLPPDLIESELFGHVKGSFTGADRTKVGKLESVEEGTFLLDEIDVLGLDQQAKLLRVLETGEFEPVGSNETRLLRGRPIVASNLDLESLVANDRFRSDLYYRLNEVKFHIPPLRKRPLDIIPLAMDFIEGFSNQHRIPVRQVHPEFLDLLKGYHWPGNIRELKNQMRRAVLFCRSGELTPNDVPPTLAQSPPPAPILHKEQAVAAVALSAKMAITEQAMIEQTLRSHNFNRAATARALGISRVTLYNKLKKYDMY